MEEADPGTYPNGDYKMIRTDKFMPIVDACKQLCDRLLALYPTQQEAIDRGQVIAARITANEGIKKNLEKESLTGYHDLESPE